VRISKMTLGFWLLLASITLSAAVTPVRAADGDPYLGSWAGTWNGQDGSSGHFTLTLQRGGDGKLGGSIAVSQDGGGGSDYTSPLKNTAFAGDKFTAAYEPPDGQSEIILKGTFAAQGGAGDWSLGAKAQPSAAPFASGSWKVVKN
jgi:hypothetical protein